MSISSRRELWDSHRKFRRKAQDRGVCLLGEWVSLITVPRCCLPTPFLDNKTLPASFHSSLRNSLLCFGRHGAAHSRPWMMQHVWWTTCVPSGCQEYTRLWSLRLLPSPKTTVFVPFPLPPKLYLPHCWVGLPTHSNPSCDLPALGGLGWCWKPPNANIKLSFDGGCYHDELDKRSSVLHLHATPGHLHLPWLCSLSQEVCNLAFACKDDISGP